MSRLLPCVEDLLSALGLAPTRSRRGRRRPGPGIVHRRAHRRRHRQGHRARPRRAALRRRHARRDRMADRARPDRSERRPTGRLLVGVVGDAMRGEVYPARFRVASGACRAPRCRTRSPSPTRGRASGRLLAEPLVLAGNGLRKYGERFADGLGDAGDLRARGLWAPSGVGLLAAYAAASRGRNGGLGRPGRAASRLHAPVRCRGGRARRVARRQVVPDTPPPESADRSTGTCAAQTAARGGS